jgi:hypothetical protein
VDRPCVPRTIRRPREAHEQLQRVVSATVGEERREPVDILTLLYVGSLGGVVRSLVDRELGGVDAGERRAGADGDQSVMKTIRC